MKIIYDIFNLKKTLKNSYITIGVFDGIHLGHKKLLESTINAAKKNKGKSVVFTFPNHPTEVIKKNFSHKYLTTSEEKISLFKNYEIDYLIIQNFDEKLANMEPIDFIRMLRENLDTKEIFVGFNFTFGKNASGNIEALKDISTDIKKGEVAFGKRRKYI